MPVDCLDDSQITINVVDLIPRCNSSDLLFYVVVVFESPDDGRLVRFLCFTSGVFHGRTKVLVVF